MKWSTANNRKRKAERRAARICEARQGFLAYLRGRRLFACSISVAQRQLLGIRPSA